MQLGMIGLGRMGANMVRRLSRAGHECVVYDVSAPAVETLAREGATGTASLPAFVKALGRPRTVVPAAIVDATLGSLAPLLGRDDVIGVEQRRELVEYRPDSRGRHHHADGSGLMKTLHEFGKRSGSAGAFSYEGIHGLRRSIVHHAGVSTPHEAPHHVGTHAPETDHAELHRVPLPA